MAQVADKSVPRVITLASFPDGMVTPDNFKISPIEKRLTESDLKDGEVLAKALFISVDPYMRGRMRPVKPGEYKKPGGNFGVGDAIRNFGVFEVTHSKSSKLPVGTRVTSVFTWCEQIKFNESRLESKTAGLRVMALPDTGKSKISPSVYLGAMGMPGMTAYYGLTVVGSLKATDNVYITGAAGAVGSVAGQISKAMGCPRVVGTAGSSEKIDFCLKECGFDVALNYKDEDMQTIQGVQKRLREAFPNGIDVVYCNVGGIVEDAMWDLLNPRARVIVCGQISVYNDKPGQSKKIDPFLFKTVYKSIRIQGFLVFEDPKYDWKPFFGNMAKWMGEGKLVAKETILDGFDNLPNAFVGLFKGTNIGKMVVNCQVASSSTEEKQD